jgi:hypothetical protein
MSKALPKTAEELCTYLNYLVAGLPEEEQQKFWFEVNEVTRQLCNLFLEEITKSHGRTKIFWKKLKKRNRRSSPKTILRNVELCDLRKQDRKKWTLGQLAKRYKVSTRAVTMVISEEPKWRRLEAELRRN